MGAIVGAFPGTLLLVNTTGSGVEPVFLGALSGAAIGFVFWLLVSKLSGDDDQNEILEKNARLVPTSSSLRQVSKEVRKNYQMVNRELLAIATKNTPDFGKRVERSLRKMERGRRLRLIRKMLLLFSYALLSICVVIIAIRGWRNIPLSMPLAAMAMAILGAFIDNLVFKDHERASAINDTLTTVKKVSEIQKNGEITEGKIPLTVGFINLAGTQLDRMLFEDATAMSRIFLRTALARNEVPKSEILFIYAELDADGLFKNNSFKNVRQLAKETTASMVILASPNPADFIRKAVNLAGPRTANLVFTIDRNGAAFSRFFQSLFQNMRGGKDMLSSWVALAPQGPQVSQTNVPVTLLFAEAGKLAFRPEETPDKTQ
ncbi:hypothetical protein CJD38_05940 [Stenotrophobium rhamnosiphilum]|uniref:Uncharacterized protein n=2 Tax=Stenotrophobium rhamnosiphilum TaxID=2029166 RepID=A0A2T5MI34_9GAMM|nr:hypothetical protein CJD38_05940 [Stenotrophobium rhamnosiphilum]